MERNDDSYGGADRRQDFLEYVQGGGQVETGDPIPDDYRAKLIKSSNARRRS